MHLINLTHLTNLRSKGHHVKDTPKALRRSDGALGRTRQGKLGRSEKV